MRPRQPSLIGKIFKDTDGTYYHGQRFIQIADSDMPTGYVTTEIHYLDGKIHGKPAIIYPDGQEEEWENGNFIAISALPYSQR